MLVDRTSRDTISCQYIVFDVFANLFVLDPSHYLLTNLHSHPLIAMFVVLRLSDIKHFFSDYQLHLKVFTFFKIPIDILVMERPLKGVI